MPTITITRSKEWMNRLRDYHIIVNDKKRGKISYAATEAIKLPAGTHTLKIKMDWMESPKITLDLKKGEQVRYYVEGFYGNTWLVPLLVLILGLDLFNRFVLNIYSIIVYLLVPLFVYYLYYLTLGRKRYFQLRSRD